MIPKLVGIFVFFFISGFCVWVTHSEPSDIITESASDTDRRVNKVVIIGGKLFGKKNESLKTSWERKKIPKNYKTSWIIQPVDHKNPEKYPTWSQRYFSNFTKYSETGPILIFVGGESAADPRFLAFGEMAQHSVEFGAVALFFLEHRFYGDSWPLGDASVQNLKYLTMYQALDDLARFIGHVKTTHNLEKNKVILYGGSYPGSLVAYFLQFYPHLASAGLASSAPIQFRFEYKEYLEITATAIGATNQNCLTILGAGVRKMNGIIQESLLNCTYLENKPETEPCPVDLSPFPLCNPLNARSPGDVNQLNNYIMEFFIFIAQYNTSLPATFNLDALCTKVVQLQDAGLDEFQILSKIMQIVAHAMYNWDCVEYGIDDVCSYMSDPERGGGSAAETGARQWMWQTCSDFASYVSTSGIGHPFGSKTLPVTHFVELCRCAFGTLFTEPYIRSRVDLHIAQFGHFGTPRPHVVYTNGEMDPVSGLGYTNLNQFQTPLPNQDNALFIVERGSHCGDLGDYNSDRDSQSLAQVRNKTLTVLKRWL